MKNIIFLLALTTLIGCKKEIFQPEPATDAPAVFEYVVKTFESWYAPTEERGIDWSALRQQYGPMLLLLLLMVGSQFLFTIVYGPARFLIGLLLGARI